MRLLVISALFAALPLAAQTAAAGPPVQHIVIDPSPASAAASIDFSVHYLGPDVIRAKYGRKLPKTIFAGSVTGTNASSQNVTFGQGFVLQQLRAKGFVALSQQDARALVLKAQSTGALGFWTRWSPVGVKILDDVESLQVLKVVTFGVPVASALATADALAKVVQPDVTQVLAQIYQNYETDGIQPLMQLAPGASIVGTLLFEAEGPKPADGADATFTVQIPVPAR